MHDTNGMSESAVISARKNKLAQTELLYATQALKLFRVNQIQKEAITWSVLEGHNVVYRIAYYFRPSRRHCSLILSEQNELKCCTLHEYKLGKLMVHHHRILRMYAWSLS